MGIDLSLATTRRTAPTQRRTQDDTVLAHARAFIPLAWALLFDPDDVVAVNTETETIPTIFTRAEAALGRLRTRGPVLRAAAGAHADGLAVLAAALTAAAPGTHIQLFLDELCNEWTDRTRDALREMVGSTTAPAVIDWRSALGWSGATIEKRRVALGSRGGTLADAITGSLIGDVPVADAGPRQEPRLAWAWTESPVASALDHVLLAHEHLDALTAVLLCDDARTPAVAAVVERAFLDALHPALAPYEGLQRRYWTTKEWHSGLQDAAAKVPDDLLAGHPTPFDALRKYPRRAAAGALAGLWPRRVGPLRKALRTLDEPLAAPLAVAARGEARCLAAARLALFEWGEGRALPRDSTDRDVIIARRIDVIGGREDALCEHDPLAVLERMAARVGGRFTSDLPLTPELAALALARVLACSRAEAREIVLDARDPSSSDEPAALEQLLPSLLLWCCSVPASDLADTARAWLRARAQQSPPDALLAGVDRDCVRLSLGDTDPLTTVLASVTPDSDRAVAVTAALRSSGAGSAAIPWLQRAAEPDVDAATLLLAAADDDVSRAVALPVLARLPAAVATCHQNYGEGLITTSERDAVLDPAIRALVVLAALAERGVAAAAETHAELRAALSAPAQEG